MTKRREIIEKRPPPEEKGQLATDAQHAQYAICSATLHKQHMWAEPLVRKSATFRRPGLGTATTPGWRSQGDMASDEVFGAGPP